MDGRKNEGIADDTGVLLVIGVGSLGDRDSSPYRETLLAGMASSFPLWLIDTEVPTWQRP